jgi:hypothetical protein
MMMMMMMTGLVYNEKRRKPRTEPCGIPVKMLEGGVECDRIETDCVQEIGSN